MFKEKKKKKNWGTLLLVLTIPSHQCTFLFQLNYMNSSFTVQHNAEMSTQSLLPIRLTNKSADGIVLLSDVADLASKGGLQRWGQCRIVPLC